MSESWRAWAACIGHLDTMMMPASARGHADNKARHAIDRAKTYCDRCPVVAECRAWAMADPDPVPEAIAGGLTPQERKQRRRWLA